VYIWGEGTEKAVQAIGLGVTGWVEVAADRAQWRALVQQYGEPEGEVKNNNNNNSSNNNSNSTRRTPRSNINGNSSYNISTAYIAMWLLVGVTV
jgi:hypothetical protein